MITIQEAAEQIAAQSAPVLFPDTCALLDLLRIPMHEKYEDRAERALIAASEILLAARQSPPNVWVVIAPPVPTEWQEHISGTIKTLATHWETLDRQLDVAHAVARSVQISLRDPEIYANQSIEGALHNLSKGFLDYGLALKRDADCLDRSYVRVETKKAPARQGSGVRDCLIVEHALALCSKLTDAGVTEKYVFISSNTKDFCKKNNSNLHPDLDADFANANLQFSRGWDWARHLLGI